MLSFDSTWMIENPYYFMCFNLQREGNSEERFTVGIIFKFNDQFPTNMYPDHIVRFNQDQYSYLLKYWPTCSLITTFHITTFHNIYKINEAHLQIRGYYPPQNRLQPQLHRVAGVVKWWRCWWGGRCAPPCHSPARLLLFLRLHIVLSRLLHR